MNSKNLDLTAEKLTQLRSLFPELFSEDKMDFVRSGLARRRGWIFGGIILSALLAFEVFNYSSTSYALQDILGNLAFGSLKWSTILAVAFCGIDFVGIVRIFAPEQGRDEPARDWYLFGAWLLAAGFNATLTWWGVSIAILKHNAEGGVLLGQQTLMNIVPIFVAGMVLLIRVLLINTFSIAGERIFNLAEYETVMKNLSNESPTLDVIHDKSSESPHDDIAEEVSFTAYHPKNGKVDIWYTLCVYTHLASAMNNVRQDAKQFGDQTSEIREVTSSSSTRITRGTEIILVPSCDGITFNPKKMSFEWMEDYHRADFRFRADDSLQNDAAKGQISVYVGPVIIGTLKFAMLFDRDLETNLVYQEEHSSMYHNDKIFISYSHKDSDIVLAFKRVYKATGYDVLIDIENLRSGQEWNPELLRMIDRADIFQLFWSENSRKSKYCKQEWEYALKRTTEGFIRPVYWESPLPKPPKELSNIHFQHVEL